MLSLRPACALTLAAAALLAGDASTGATATRAQQPLLVVVDLTSQRLVAYRDGAQVAASPVSTGKPGYATPAGVFTILQKKSFHRSNQYSNAPMPFMQRLTWQGVALHAGALPGYPASHGCIRLPYGFARQLFAETRTGMTVMVTGARATRSRPVAGPAWWRPGLADKGPLTIVVSGADRRMIVLRDGVQIGSAPVAFNGAIERAQAWVLRADSSWTRVALPGEAAAAPYLAPAPSAAATAGADPFQRALGAALAPGATMLVVPDSLAAGIGALPLPRQLFGDEELIEEWLADDAVSGGR